MSQDVYARIAHILVDTIGVEPAEVMPDADLRQDLELDSLSMLQLLTSLEEEFDRPVDDTKVRELRTVAAVVSYVEASLAGEVVGNA